MRALCAYVFVLLGKTLLGQAFIDLRTAKYAAVPTITDSYYEGPCASAWAIAPIMAFTDEWNYINMATKGVRRMSYQYLMECCTACFAGFANGCRGGDYKTAMSFLQNNGVVEGSNFQAGSQYCKNYKFRECTTDPLRSVNGSPPLCTDADLDISNAVDGCSSVCTPGSIGNNEIHKITSIYLISGTGNYQSTIMSYLSNNRQLVIAMMFVYEDLFEYRSSSELYEHTYGRMLGQIAVVIYGFQTYTPTGQQYWIVRLPFGGFFGGDNGYIKVVKGTNSVGLETPYWLYTFTLSAETTTTLAT